VLSLSHRESKPAVAFYQIDHHVTVPAWARNRISPSVQASLGDQDSTVVGMDF
jgi:hypothetical protein